MSRNLWQRDELILAFNLYCKIPFGKINAKNPQIVALAQLINRSPGAVSFKLSNFASLDPALKQRGIAGASHGSKADVAVWNEFYNNWEALAFESEQLLASLQPAPAEPEISLIELPIIEGLEREQLRRVRVNQHFFRKMVLAAYDQRCCITGLTISSLLNASHIVPWAHAAEQRVNPHNGLCLNTLHDRAFDRGLITITPDYRIQVAATLIKSSANSATNDLLLAYDQRQIELPARFQPDPAFLRYHNQHIFQG
ncbi:HNH endonuclease [Herpetosiphon llansteffanensis]|uniref:HNH endonuclease n=1 Tax=Herpetosiphon llansteffanensis TaxID=2094568 RepID=UPI000D7C3734|nr:HNH endonuclease [Herpetosiphon llansteffanensis]